ncbi:GrpB family protein [uncultured Alistipes sp.]|jgi:hypothetical protein|uniref:GrpB family protein n=1 Tax=uncultured Alistipes sp. TaxID=538949 RepID=UPI0025EEA87D|nr:GrpB family protein [uncultured Alistipes sp.]
MNEGSLQEMTDEQLWKLFPIVLRPHNANWAGQFSAEKSLIVHAIGADNIERISHIGSTAIPGIAAKPTVDILLEITEQTDLRELRKSLENSGYIFSEQADRPAPHMMFMKGYTPAGFAEKVYHLHVRYRGDWDEFYFRDYLIAHPEEAQRYAELKMELKSRYEHDRDAYTAAKSEFIKRIVKKARKGLTPVIKQNKIGI